MTKQERTENITFLVISAILTIIFIFFFQKLEVRGKILGCVLSVIMLGVGLWISYIYRKIEKPEEIPNLWTGLGILFTFISFLIAFGTSEIEIEILIPKISAAFTTSIAGLVMSKLATYLLKKREYEQEKNADYKSPEEILNSIVSTNKKLEETLSDFKTNISSSIITGVEEGLKTTLSQTISDLDEKIEKLDKAFDNIIDEAKGRQSNVKDMTEKFQKFVELQNETNGAMETMMNVVQQQLEKIKALDQERKHDIEYIVNNKDIDAKFNLICNQLEQIPQKTNHA